MENLLVPLEYRQDETTGVSWHVGWRFNGVWDASFRDRAEMFEMDSLHWDASGIVIREQHNRQAPILRAVPYVEGRELRINAPLLNTTRGRDIAEAMKGPTPLFSGLSVEFRAEKGDPPKRVYYELSPKPTWAVLD